MSKEINETLRIIDQVLNEETQLLDELQRAVQENYISEPDAEAVLKDFHDKRRWDVT